MYRSTKGLSVIIKFYIHIKCTLNVFLFYKKWLAFKQALPSVKLCFISTNLFQSIDFPAYKQLLYTGHHTTYSLCHNNGSSALAFTHLNVEILVNSLFYLNCFWNMYANSINMGIHLNVNMWHSEQTFLVLCFLALDNFGVYTYIFCTLAKFTYEWMNVHSSCSYAWWFWWWQYVT